MDIALEMAGVAGASDGGEGFMSSPAIGISPEVGVFDADDSLEGEATFSPRSRAWVDGESWGAR